MSADKIAVKVCEPVELILDENGNVIGCGFTEELTIEEIRKRYPMAEIPPKS